MTKTDEVLQWAGALFIIAGHLLNTLLEYEFDIRPWNIAAFTIGTVFFLIWSLRVMNRPQMAVNVVAITIGVLGLFRALG